MPLRRKRQFAAVCLDGAIFATALWLAVTVRYGTFIPPESTWVAIAVAPIVGVSCLIGLGFYRELIRYLGQSLAVRCALGVSLTTLILLAISFLLAADSAISRIIFLPFWMGSVLGIIGVRVIARELLRANTGSIDSPQRRVLIYGAGEAGAGLASMLDQDGTINVCCFIDDNPALEGQRVRGTRIHSAPAISELVSQHKINTVMLALPSASKARRREVIDLLSGHGVAVLTVPDLEELTSGAATVKDLRPIEIADLLGRETVEPHDSLLRCHISGRVVLVTGAGGSIGTELCRQIIALAPARLVLVDNSEFNLYQIEQEIRRLNRHGAAIVPVLGDVCDSLRIRELMQVQGIQTVYHTAAYKHVPIVEENVVVGVRNNVLGTLRTAEAAIQAGVKNFVQVSTDKAVRPTSVMGASKRLAEIVLQGLNVSELNQSDTSFCMVRFGNVLGSSGSAVPKFMDQITKGGPVTVTHEEVTRYFMTVNEAANLVIQAGSLAKGGDVFVLDMGDPVKIADLATRMIELSGSSVRNEQNPHGEIEIQFTGLRPGEKLYEELLIDGDLEGTAHPKILRSAEPFLEWEHCQVFMQRLEAALDRRDEASVQQILMETVSGYRSAQNQAEEPTTKSPQSERRG